MLRICLRVCVDWSSCYKEEISSVNLPGDCLSFPNLLGDWPLHPSLTSPYSPLPSVALCLGGGSPACPGMTHWLLL